ncbi:M15 family metallopeptidase [Oceanimonas smirnovii]|uniref:M15 family metallopeptidase n=1 Tax=Oceanimonas smirnovii TaxID=264574 RepID=UPI003FCF724C
MTFRFSQRSEQNLQGVHPDLVAVVRKALALTEVDFMVTEGVRAPERQRELVKRGASQTMNSLHLPQADGYAYAVDLAAWVGGVRWDWPLYHKLAEAMKQAGAELGIPIEWGGDWKTFKDGPHFQLPRGYRA